MYKKELEFIKNNIINIYEFALKQDRHVMDKGAFDTVTNVDYEIEKLIIKEINKQYPHDHIISEEFNPDAKVVGRTWVIDPIDGTVNFARNMSYFGIQMALFDNNEVVLAVIYLPRLNEFYAAEKGKGTTLNGKVIKISTRTLGQSIVSFSDFFTNAPQDLLFQEKIFFGLYKKLFRTRVFGAASVDFAMLASGNTDGVILRTYNLWDLAPGYLIGKEAGTKFYNEKLEPYKFGDYAMFALNNDELKTELSEILELQ